VWINGCILADEGGKNYVHVGQPDFEFGAVTGQLLSSPEG